MFDAWRQFSDRLLGRGSAAITVPVMDGALKPNRSLDEAAVIAPLPGIDDLATDGRTLYASAGKVLYRLEGTQPFALHRFNDEVTALAAASDGTLAVALAGRSVLTGLLHDDVWRTHARLDGGSNGALQGVNALHFEDPGTLLLSEGSDRHAPSDWCRDLMEKGRSGRVTRWRTAPNAEGSVEVLIDQLQHAWGVLSLDGQLLYSESWRHRVGRVADSDAMVADFPCYPSRMAPAQAGGFWLTCFARRTQLVEFVLREETYRRQMLATVDPRYWIAPALRSGESFLEPLQGAGVKQMGVLKPWAPPRSYGLVLHVDAQGRVDRSLHSQVDGRHHGITAAAELAGTLYLASKGGDRLLGVRIDGSGETT